MDEDDWVPKQTKVNKKRDDLKEYQIFLVNDGGNPGIFLLYPYPYPPTPTRAQGVGVGFWGGKGKGYEPIMRGVFETHTWQRTPESHLKGMFQHSIFLIRAFCTARFQVVVLD